MIDRHFVPLLAVLTLHLSARGRDHRNLNRRHPQCLHWFGQFDLLKPVGGEDGDFKIGDAWDNVTSLATNQSATPIGPGCVTNEATPVA